MGTLLTPEKAAQRAGVSRRTILRAVQAQALRAVRDNRNRWRIDADALDAWAMPRMPTGRSNGRAQPDAHFCAQQSTELRVLEAERNLLREQVASRDAELSGVRALLEAALADRDQWRELARQPWWQRMFGQRLRR